MADTKLSNLSPAASVAGTDLLYVVQTPGVGGVKATSAQVKDYITGTSSTWTASQNFASGGSFGTVGSVLGTASFAGSTSGSVTLQPNAVAGTTTLTLPATTGTIALTSDLSAYAPLAGATFTGPVSVDGASFSLTGNISAPAWTTNGIRYKNVAATLTDTTSTGTVATAYTNVFGGNTIAASNATTFTNYYTTYINQPTAGTNVTLTNRWALGVGGNVQVTGQVSAGNNTVTTSAPILDLSQTWNAGAVTFTALKANITDTASAAASLLMDLQVGGLSKASVDKNGLFSTMGNTGGGFKANLSNGVGFEARWGAAFVIANITGDGAGYMTVSADGAFRFSSGSLSVSSPDVIIRRDAAGILAQRNSTNAQTFRVYNTYTDASNYERGVFDWATTANTLTIGTQNAGTGTTRNFQVVIGGVSRLDYGISNANQWFVKGVFQSESSFYSGADVRAAANASFYWNGRTNITAPADGNLLIGNLAQNDFGRMMFGGTTASFPSIKRSTTILQARLADDSGYASFQGKLTTETAYTAGDPTTTGYLVLYDSTGTAYKVPAVAV